MEKTAIRVLFSTLLLSCLTVQTCAKTQSQALGHLFKAKWKKDSTIVKSQHSNSHHVLKGDEILPQDGLKENDRIVRLPGQPPNVGFKQYGGYVTVNEKAGRAFYYYFAEAHSSQKDLPLVLWLNGGPGCSSIGYGAMEELGPFRIFSDGKTLYQNKHAWNKAANVLFLESPVGVGFSYSNTSDDYQNNGDKKTSADNLIFLLNWLERFPEYKTRDFYISGESYAGHYVPQLAHNVLHHNKMAKKTIINLKGILIGNAVINDETDNWGTCDYFASHALISDKSIEDLHKYCDFSPNGTITDECVLAVTIAGSEIGSIHIDNIYAPFCFDGNLTANPKRVTQTFDPCTDNYVYEYLNRPDVQEAMHANVTKLTYPWEACGGGSGWTDSPWTVLPLLQELLANGLRVWVFSGDIDGNVPVTGTRYSINVLKLPTTTSWYAWYHHGEVSGYTQVYGMNLTFATVREAGHEVPSFQPLEVLLYLVIFFSGNPSLTIS